MKTMIDPSSHRLITWLAALALAACPEAQALLTVSNVQAAQQSGTKLVNITYDVTGSSTPVNVSLAISEDGGTTWTVPATTTQAGSDIGPNITPAAGLHITWNAGTDWNKKQSARMRFRITVAASSDLFALIPAGSFTMGDALDKDTDAPTHAVNVNAFCMQKKEVSKAQWTEVRTWALTHGYTHLAAGTGKADTYPIGNVTWYNAARWCNARSEKEGLTPCYYTNNTVHTTATVYRTGNTNLSNTMVKRDADGYRLPTEAEWEKAARGGLSGKRFPWGDTITHSQANYYVALSSDGKTHLYSYDVSPTTLWNPAWKTVLTPYTAPVGSFAANPYGLYDMAGNVREWCWDRYRAAYYTTAPTDDPPGPVTADSGAYRVLRGGDWTSTANSSRVAYRYDRNPGTLDRDFGFRTVHQQILSSINLSEITVDTREWLLTIVPSTSAKILDVATNGVYVAGSTASLTAEPNAGYSTFMGWRGASTSTTNPLALLMDADKTLGATFAPDYTDPDTDGLTNYDEAVIYGTDPAKADTDDDGFNDKCEVDLGANPLVATSFPGFMTHLVPSASSVQFSFPAKQGRSYTVETSTDLIDWNDIAADSNMPGEGELITRAYPVTSLPQQFFRVREN